MKGNKRIITMIRPAKIARLLDRKVARLTKSLPAEVKGSWKKTALLMALAVLLFGGAAVARPGELPAAGAGLAFALIWYVMLRVQSMSYQIRILYPLPRMAGFLGLFLPFYGILAVLFILGWPAASFPLLTGFVVLISHSSFCVISLTIALLYKILGIRYKLPI